MLDEITEIYESAIVTTREHDIMQTDLMRKLNPIEDEFFQWSWTW